MATIDNVIEMLTNIIGVDAPPGVDPEDSGAMHRDRKISGGADSSNDDSEPEKLKTKVIESMKQRSKAKEASV